MGLALSMSSWPMKSSQISSNAHVRTWRLSRNELKTEQRGPQGCSLVDKNASCTQDADVNNKIGKVVTTITEVMTFYFSMACVLGIDSFQFLRILLFLKNHSDFFYNFYNLFLNIKRFTFNSHQRPIC